MPTMLRAPRPDFLNTLDVSELSEEVQEGVYCAGFNTAEVVCFVDDDIHTPTQAQKALLQGPVIRIIWFRKALWALMIQLFVQICP